MRAHKELVAVHPDFRVIMESGDWIVVDKAAPLIVHPTNGKVEPTLLGGVEALLSYEIANGAKLSIINRLDRETSGLVLLAKHAKAARLFGCAMERRLFVKEYDALCYGWPEWQEKTVEAPILRKGEVEESPIWLKQMVHPDGRFCETRFQVVSRHRVEGQQVARLRVFPKTGRMHQIRVHAQHLGFPLLGDKIYGRNEQYYLDFIAGKWTEHMAQDLMLPRHALHAAKMGVAIEGQQWQWEARLAVDLAAFLDAGLIEI